MYKHGTYGEMGGSVVTAADKSETVTVYIGTAPVNLIRGYGKKGIINEPFRIENMSVKNALGYSEDWDMFTLCEVMDAHFNNPKGNIGPVYVVNVLDPDTHRKHEQTTKNITFSNGTAEIESDTIILDTLAIDDKVEGTDYILNYANGKAVIKSVTITGTVQASYYEVTGVTKEDIIGGVTEDSVYTGISVAERIYPVYGAIPTLYAAPKWSGTPEVYSALVSAAQQMNGHWYGFVLADIPITESTAKKAIRWKQENGYNSMYSKVCWPMVTYAGRKYHISTLAAVELMRNDIENDGVPMGTCSNKSIKCDAQYFGDATNQGFDTLTGNELNAKGITTVVAWNGIYQLWGPHTAGYEADGDGNAKADVDMLAIFDSNIRMQEYLLNEFQATWGTLVDEPMTIGLRDSILESEQERLDGLAARGALIGDPSVEFSETENSDEDILNGNFRWKFTDTPAPLGKSYTAKVVCTDSGFTALITTGEEAE